MDASPPIWVQRLNRPDFAAEAGQTPLWLQSARCLGRWRSPANHLSTALEVALWSLAGEPVQDGLFPWGEWGARRAGHGEGHWAKLHLCHWHVSNGQVNMLRPHWPQADALDQLWAELADFVASDGLTLVREQPYCAWVRGDALAQQPTAALDKVMGRPVAPFLPASRTLRRLQNELQMWLYTHPLLQGQSMPINSVWWSGTGALTPALAQVMNQLNEDAEDQPPPSGTRVLMADDVQSSLWQVGQAPAWQRLWRRWRPVSWANETHELD